jgi:hypothetical protein
LTLAPTIVLVNLTAKEDKLPIVDADEKKSVTVETIRLTCVQQANAKVDPEREHTTRYRRRVIHRHWHHDSRGRRH